jgi:hypothetical protein
VYKADIAQWRLVQKKKEMEEAFYNSEILHSSTKSDLKIEQTTATTPSPHRHNDPHVFDTYNEQSVERFGHNSTCGFDAHEHQSAPEKYPTGHPMYAAQTPEYMPHHESNRSYAHSVDVGRAHNNGQYRSGYARMNTEYQYNHRRPYRDHDYRSPEFSSRFHDHTYYVQDGRRVYDHDPGSSVNRGSAPSGEWHPEDGRRNYDYDPNSAMRTNSSSEWHPRDGGQNYNYDPASAVNTSNSSGEWHPQDGGRNYNYDPGSAVNTSHSSGECHPEEGSSKHDYDSRSAMRKTSSSSGEFHPHDSNNVANKQFYV